MMSSSLGGFQRLGHIADDVVYMLNSHRDPEQIFTHPGASNSSALSCLWVVVAG